jgi:hypothetical protein
MLIEILGLLGIAALAIEVAYHSDLAYGVKKLLRLTEDNQNTLGILGTFKFWNSFLYPYLSWLSFIPVLFFFFYKKLSELLNCPFCTGFWLSLGFSLSQGFTVIPAIALTGVTLITTYLIQLIDAYSNR